MTWGTEMKSLVSDIKTSKKDRLQFVKGNQQDTADLLARFDTELKDMAQDLKNFLDKSEKDRMSDFRKMMEDIQARIKAIQARVKDLANDTHGLMAQFKKELKEMAADLKDFLAKSEQTRMADFKTTMRDIQSRVDAIQKHVADLLSGCKEEREEAHASWGTLIKREKAIVEEKVEKPKKVEKVSKSQKKKKK